MLSLSMQNEPPIGSSIQGREGLIQAIRDHTAGYVHEDPAICAWWEADRLKLQGRGSRHALIIPEPGLTVKQLDERFNNVPVLP